MSSDLLKSCTKTALEASRLTALAAHVEKQRTYGTPTLKAMFFRYERELLDGSRTSTSSPMLTATVIRARISKVEG